ncbi:Sodium/hydrogen exchanger 8 [Diplonema papillatum]|nr:Sodium/hydrogen exchanger 8 [Diplonema papillatum]
MRPAVLLAAVCLAATNAPPAPAPQPQVGSWPDYCRKNNVWEPSTRPYADYCKDLEEAECTHACTWVTADKKCVDVGCVTRKDEASCRAIAVCEWEAAASACVLEPAPPECELKIEDTCVKALKQGCVWVNNGCSQCSKKNETACDATLGECEWVVKAECVVEEGVECDVALAAAPCNAEPNCEFNATSGLCEVVDCEAVVTDPTCVAEPACRWREGTCHTGELTCEAHDSEGSCALFPADCEWIDAAKCVAPHCESIVSEKVCSGSTGTVRGCEWMGTRCERNATATDCTALDRLTCLVDPLVGCLWKEVGCHQKHEEYLSECTNLVDGACTAVDGCVWEQTRCEETECKKYNEWECDAKEECVWAEDKCVSESEEEHHEHEGHEPPYNILVIFVIGALGAFFRHNFSDSRLPYTVILFVSGAAFDGLSQIDAFSELKKYVGLAHIDPHLLFYIFLPVLIFESAYAVDWFIFKQVLGHCILLAGPGICVATALTALPAKYFKYDWSWEASLLFGVTLSATDPVAVVALLKELGASPQISTLIEGESLLNDGTAIVFFTILQTAVAGCSGHIEESAGSLVLELIKVSLGGPLLGYVCGAVSAFCLSKVFNDPLIEITTSLVTAYVTFFFAEAYFHVSGVLAVVVCGIYLSHRKQCISPEVHHTLHEFWEMSVYLGNTLIFTMAGMIVAGRAFAHVTFIDFLYLVVVYVVINVVRFFVVKVFSVVYNNFFDYRLNTGNMALVAWGGLRGAVGLALALIIAGDHRLTMRDENDPRTILQNKLVFFLAGIVVLTLLVNGVTTRNLVQHFKLDQVSDTKKRMMRDNFKRLKAGGMDQLEDLKIESALYDVNWLVAKKWVFEDMKDPYNNEDEFLGEGDQHAEAVMHYFKIMHASVWDQNEEGLLDGDAVRFLLAEINAREKLAKKKEAEQLSQADYSIAGDSYAVMPGSPELPASPALLKELSSFDAVTVAIKHVSLGRTLHIKMDGTGNVLRLKKKIYNEENMPVAQQKLIQPETGRVLGNDENIASLSSHNKIPEIHLERLNPDEDILLNASILEEFWRFEAGLYGKFEEFLDKVYRLGKSSYREQKWTYGFNVAMALVTAHDAVLAKIDNIADPGEANKLKTHAKQVKREVLQQLVTFAQRAPHTSIAMKTTLAARTVLNHARRKVWIWQKEGLIEDKEADVLVGLVEQKMKELTRVEVKMQSCNPDYILQQMEWYENASSEIKDLLKTRRRTKKFARGQLLIEKGNEHDNIVLITSGSARVHVSRRFDYVGPGYAAGILSSLTGTTKYCDVYAETDLTAMLFSAETFLNTMRKKGNENFAQALWRATGVDLAYKVLRGIEPYSKWQPREVRKFVDKGRLLELPKYRPEDKRVSLAHGCYHILISGQARDATNQSKDAKLAELEVFEAPVLLPVDCHEVYLQTRKWTPADNETGQQWFAAGDKEAREDEVQVLIVEDPANASARARKYWDKIYKKIRSIKTTAALRGADVKRSLAEAFGSNMAAPGSPLNLRSNHVGASPTLPNFVSHQQSSPLLLRTASVTR